MEGRETHVAITICKHDNCDRPLWARGWCRLHWQRWYRGHPLDGKPRRVWMMGGYRYIWRNGAAVAEHRDMMERHLGRQLHVDDVVHHKDGNKTNNVIENLEVLPRALHTSLHRPKRKPCAICGKDDPHQARGLCGKHYMQKRYRELKARNGAA